MRRVYLIIKVKALSGKLVTYHVPPGERVLAVIAYTGFRPKGVPFTGFR